MGLMSFDGEGDGKSLFADINVTPLVDVMLVLLIIFMVTAPFMIETIGVNLPKGEGQKAMGLAAPLTISIDKFEAVSIAGQVFDIDGLAQFLKESPRVKAGEPIYIEADEAIHHKTLMMVMSKVYAAGGETKIHLMMEQP